MNRPLVLAALLGLLVLAPARAQTPIGGDGTFFGQTTPDPRSAPADRPSGILVTPTEHGSAAAWDPAQQLVKIRGTGNYPLSGKPVRNSADGILYRVTENAVIIGHRSASGKPYYISYAPLAVDPAIRDGGLARTVPGGTPLGTVAGPELNLQAWEYAEGGGFVFKPFGVPGLRYPSGTDPGAAGIEF